MSRSEFSRLDSAAMEEQAALCRRERYLAKELAEELMCAASLAPMELSSRTRILSEQADRLAGYYEKMEQALLESGQITEGISERVANDLEDASAQIAKLLIV